MAATTTERLDRFQRRHPGAGFPLAVLYKYVDDQGGYLAALITLHLPLHSFCGQAGASLQHIHLMPKQQQDKHLLGICAS